MTRIPRKKWNVDPESVILLVSVVALLAGVALYDYRAALIVAGLAGGGILAYRRRGG